MDKMNLYKCAQALSVKWKSFFGLGTEYVGYFKWEMAWALMGYYRYALPGEWADNASPTVILKSICDSIESINTDLDCAHEFPEFWLNRDQLPVLPALMSVLDQYEEDIIDASNAEWEEWIGFLKSKCPDVRKKQMIQ
jgi:hypothetical protein